MNLLLSEPILHSRQLLHSQRSSEGEGGSRPMSCICGEAPQGKAAVDPHPVTAEWDGAHIVFVAKLSRRRWQSTHTLLL